MVSSKSVPYFCSWAWTTLTNSGLLINALEEAVEHGAIVHTTVAIIYMTLHNGMLVFVEGKILVPIPCLSLTITVGILQLSFCFCSLPGHMVRAKKMLVNIKVHCSTVLCCFSLFHIDISIHVCEHLLKNLVHHGIVDLECINLVTEIDSIQGFLSHLEV